MPETPQLNSDEKLLAQIREDFRYVKESWNENFSLAEKDMNFAAGIPPEEFKSQRKDRPCIWPDEISQYLKQTCNNLRQNKRSIKISPRSEDATDVDAEHRQAYIRGIEYASKAQSIYTTAFESAVQCGFGYWKIVLRITGPNGEQEPRLVRIPNQFAVYPDPDAQEADFSDANLYFVLGPPMREKNFQRRFPNAKKTSFSAGDRQAASEWFHGDDIVPAEYWTRREIDKKDGEKRYQVTQYITNGVEILDTHEWIGSWIPIVGVFGEEKYIKAGGSSKRVFMSLQRRAHDSQQMLAYLASQQAEEFNKAPSSPYIVLDGTVDAKEWEEAHDATTLYLRWKVPVDWQHEWGPPPMPTRNPFVPNAQAYSIAFEQYRRSIMSSMGLQPLPTAAQRQNEKSGIAIERIQTQEAIGAFHFTDNFTWSLGNSGRQINELITKLARLNSLPAQLLGKDQKDEDRILRIAPYQQASPEQNQPNLPSQPASQPDQDPASEHLQEADVFFAHRGQFEVTISDGPNYLSQREEQAAFSDHLLEVLPQLGLPPQITQAVAAIAVKMKNVGALGDEIANLLSPPDPNNLPPQAKAILAQSQGAIQQLQGAVQQLMQEREAKVIEGHFKVWAEQIKAETAKVVAEINTKSQILSERIAAIEELQAQLHSQAHESALSAQEHAQGKQMADKQAEAAASQQATQIAADQQNQNSAEPSLGA